MIRKIQKILVPLDGSKNSIRGFEKALSIAQPTGAMITGLYVVHIPIRSALRITPQQRKKEIFFAESIIGDVTERARNENVAFKPRVETGNPSDKITQIAKSGGFDMVVIGSRGMSGKKEILLGSVSNHVLHKADIPVLVVK